MRLGRSRQNHIITVEDVVTTSVASLEDDSVERSDGKTGIVHVVGVRTEGRVVRTSGSRKTLVGSGTTVDVVVESSDTLTIRTRKNQHVACDNVRAICTGSVGVSQVSCREGTESLGVRIFGEGTEGHRRVGLRTNFESADNRVSDCNADGSCTGVSVRCTS